MTSRVVTALVAATRGRVAIELDGDPWLVVDLAVIVHHQVAVGCILEAASLAAIDSEARAQLALERGAKLLSRRSHARGELESRLARKDGAEAAQRAAERLAELGAIDDERHAQEVAASLLQRGWGPARIEHDLTAAGVAEALVRSTLAAVSADRIDAAARVAIGSRLAGDAWRRLASRGFDEDVAERLAGPPLEELT